jgi:tetratricopeptide (TPR) repeat protein
VDKTKIFAAAEKAVLKGQIPKAIEALNQIVQKDPRDAKALNKLADLYLKESQKDKAVDILKKVGEIYHRDGFYSKAAAIYKRILKIEDQSPKEKLIEVHERLAELYQQLDLASEAMPHFKIVVDYYDQTANRESLLRVLKHVSDLDPGNLDSQLKLAELFVAQGKAAEAKDLLLRLEETIAAERSLAEMARFYEKSIELFPDDTDNIRKLVETYLSGSEPKRALAVLQKAFRVDPYNPQILELLSETFRKLSQGEKSRAVDVELIKIYRKEGLQEKLSIVEARVKGEPAPVMESPKASVRKELSETIDAAEHLLREGKSSPEESKILSECEVYLKYGLIEKAREVLVDQLQNFPKSLSLRWKLKIVYSELQDTDASRGMLEEILMLAKEQKNPEWISVATGELEGGRSSAPSVAAATESAVIDNGVSSISDPDESDISIIVDEGPELLEESAPLETEAPLEEDFAADLEVSAAHEVLELSDEAEDSAALELSNSEEVEADEPEELVDGEFLLSEEDFSEKELQQLGAQLGGEVPKGSTEVSPTPDSDSLDSAPLEIASDSGEVAGDEDFEIRQGLEEIAFFRSQGLDGEAEELLSSLQAKYPQHRNWDIPVHFDSGSESEPAPMPVQAAKPGQEKRVDLEALGTKMKLTVQEDDRSDMEDFFDFAGDLQEELDDLDGGASDLPVEVRDVFNAFKEGVAQSVSEDDVDTHFDLAIAYREMGLMDDAFKAFELCAKTEKRRIEAMYQMGMILKMKEDLDSAKDTFLRALEQPQVGNQEKLSLFYELGEVFMALDDTNSAKKFFEDVQNLDPQFREVQQRLAQLA